MIKDTLSVIGVVLLGVVLSVLFFLAAVALVFGFGYALGLLIVWMIPSLGVWATTTLGVSFPTSFGVLFVIIRALFGAKREAA